MELENWKKKFESIGINVAAMTYDSPEIIKSFRAEKSLTYTLLRDENAQHVNAFGIRNEAYVPGDPGYGVPHPGILLFDEEGVLLVKLAEPGFKNRPSFAELYDAVEASLNN